MAFAIERIFPTEQDVGSTEDGGSLCDEDNWSDLIGGLSKNYVESGLTVTVNSPDDLDLTVAAGVAVIRGHRIVVTGTQEIETTASTFWRLWLSLTRSDGDVDGYAVTLATDETVPTDAVILEEGRSGSSAVNPAGHFDRRVKDGGVAIGTCNTSSLTGGANVVLGFRPRLVICASSGGLNAAIASDSGFTFPLQGTGTVSIQDYGFTPAGNVDTTASDYFAI